MSETELKIALQHDGEIQIRGFWQRAEAAVANRREEIEAELAQLRTKTDRQLQTEANTLRNTVLFEAQARAMGCRLQAEAELDERLRQLAQQMLAELAGHDSDALWTMLRDELPAADWTTLSVHPADRQQADRDFPTATTATDETLGGGLIVTNSDGTIRIDNSLRCRLLRAWPDLLPKLLEELRKQVDNNATAHTNTTG